MFVRAACAFLLATSLLAPAAQADGRMPLGIEKEICVLNVGPDAMHFTAYQPRFGAHRPQETAVEFCKDIPDVGPVLIVLDYVDMELREMRTDVRVIKAVDGRTGSSEMSGILHDAQMAPEALDPVTEKYLPPRLYPTGIIKFEHTFTSPGKYFGIVTVKNDHGQIYVSHFPFSVGQTHRRMILAYSLFAAPIIAGFFFYYWKFGRKHRLTASAKKA
ncbi:hypothetical protein [Methylocapsa aurea]|uniref:hypothetical protein n=1 Tax=Methylocapsa aurea TaxID=663610 RepID=UPI00068E89DC|nr:hypothetical protein [Methylocapsa aurea]